MRAYLGRWAIGMTSSEEYVRTARQVVYKIQQSVNRALVEGREGKYLKMRPSTAFVPQPKRVVPILGGFAMGTQS